MTGTWVFGGASARGAAHKRRNLPNQDAIGWQLQCAGPHAVAAVSDGHGAPAHFRSADGARLAVAAAAAVLEAAILAAPVLDAARLPGLVVSAWQEAVMSHAASLAASDAWVEPLHDTLLPYGATLVATAVRADLAIVLQIGDGDLYLGYPDDRMERPLPDDAGLVGEQTRSLCAPDAVQHVRVAALHGDAAQPDFVMLSTDGVSKSFADEDAVRTVARHYRASLLSGEAEAVFAQLPEWLDSVSSRGSGDDVTLCLGIRR